MDKQREEFEAWYVKTYPFASTMPGKFEREGCDYTDTTVNVAWQAFQYAQALEGAQPDTLGGAFDGTGGKEMMYILTQQEHAQIVDALENVYGKGKLCDAALAMLKAMLPVAQAAQNHIEQDLVMVSTQPAQVPEGWKQAVKLAYGHLWHVNNEPMTPVPLRSPEKAAYEARKVLRDMLTHEERGEAINAVAAMLAAAPSTKEPGK